MSRVPNFLIHYFCREVSKDYGPAQGRWHTIFRRLKCRSVKEGLESLSTQRNRFPAAGASRQSLLSTSAAPPSTAITRVEALLREYWTKVQYSRIAALAMMLTVSKPML
jgi:hypothetical protein